MLNPAHDSKDIYERDGVLANSAKQAGLVARRYAEALIDLAAERKALEPVERDVQTLEKLAFESNDWRAFLAHPRASVPAQAAVLNELATKAQFHELTRNFLGTLVKNRRLAGLSEILVGLRNELAKRRGAVSADVQTAFALSPEQTHHLQERLSKAMGQYVTLNVSVDKDLLGGMVVTVGSKQIDDSVRTKLERLERAMKSEAA